MGKYLPPGVDWDQYTVPITLGGTAAPDLATAASNLKLVTTAQVNQPLGPVGLDSTGKVDSAKLPDVAGTNRVNVQGNFNVVISTVVAFVITDYDSFKSYTITATAGTVSRVGDTITYTAPGTAQTVTLTINGRALTVSVNLPAPAQPTITSPTSGSTNLSTLPAFTSSAFTAVGDSSTHTSSDWQLSTDSGFSSIAVQSLNDTTNKTTWTPATALTGNTLYYARVRYKGSNGNYSQYSPTISFTTRPFDVATVEEAKLVASDKAAGAYFGYAIALSHDGVRCVVGIGGGAVGVYVFVRNTTTNTWSQETLISIAGYHVSIDGTGVRLAAGTAGGTVYVYLRTGTTWALEQALTASGQFGISCSLDATATRLAAGSNTGQFVIIYLRTGTTWAVEQTISGTSNWGCYCALSADGFRLVQCIFYTPSTSGVPSCQVYKRTGTTWALEQNISPTTTSTLNDYFGGAVALDGTGTRLLVTAKYNDTATGVSDSGCAYVFVRNTTTNVWTQEAVLVADSPISAGTFGCGGEINNAGNVIAIGSAGYRLTEISPLFIFTRSGSTWTQSKKFIASDIVAGDNDSFNTAYNYQQLGLAKDSTRVAYAAMYGDPGGTSNAGCAYIFA